MLKEHCPSDFRYFNVVSLILFGHRPGRQKRYRNPIELNWPVNFDHDFSGKDVLQRLSAKPERTIKTLIWNTEDVLDVFSSLFRKGEKPYRWMDFTIERAFSLTSGSNRLFHDDVFDKDGKLAGFSSGREYSLHYMKKADEILEIY